MGKRRKKQATEAFNFALPTMRQERALGMSNAAAAFGAMPAVDSELARGKHQADIDLQNARLAKVEEVKRTHVIEKRELLAHELKQARDEYKRIRVELRTEKAATERDELYIAAHERDLATARGSLSRV